VAAAVVAAGCAAAAWLVGDRELVLRLLPAGAALAAVAAAVLLRRWDRYAGRRVSEADARRASAEWRADERQAELEEQLDEAREQRRAAERRLRAKRTELAGLRTEHAALLRRYATAESERARVLERNRQLQVGDAPKQQLALTTGGGSPLGPAVFLKAEQALRDLARNAATQQARATVDAARRREAAAPDEPQGRHTAAAAASHAAARPPQPAGREHRLVPAAAAVLPYAQPPAPAGTNPRAVGGFDFFGTQKALPPSPAAIAVEAAPAPEGEHAQAEEPAEVIDLTAHDDTEQLDMSGLRAVPSQGAAK